jgi:hypothetical protein
VEKGACLEKRGAWVAEVDAGSLPPRPGPGPGKPKRM